MKIIQKGRQITADFTDLENQYSIGTIEIPVEFTDTTFNNYSMWYSAQIQNLETQNYIARLVENKIVLPQAITYHSGAISISIYGIMGSSVLTSNLIMLNIIESNPTADQVKPTTNDWAETVREYADAYTAERISKITPTISSINKHWLIGGVDTGIIAEGHADIQKATATTLGGVKIGKSLKIDSSGILEKNVISKTITLSRSGWNSNNVYTLRDNLITSTSNQSILPTVLNNPPTTTQKEYIKKLQKMNLACCGQGLGYLYLCALGGKPNEDINVLVVFEN